MAMKKGAKKAAPRRRQYRRKARVPRAPASKSDYASCSDVIGVFNAVNNTPYMLYNIALTNSTRAKAIAQGYQFYRISKVEVKWKPYQDTFQAGVGAATVPTLYYMIDKANTFPSNTTIDTLKQAGARPRRLDDKILSCSFAPAVHIASDDGVSGPATVVETAATLKTSPWLTTNANAGGTGFWTPNGVDHRGLVFYIEQTTGVTNTGVASVEVVVHYQFKKPLWSVLTGDDTIHRLNLDTLEIEPPAVKA